MSIVANLVQFTGLMLYRIDYGAIGEHKIRCNQLLEEGNAPRNIKCVLAKEVYVPGYDSNN